MRKILRKTAIILLWLIIWQLLSAWVDSEILLVSPVRAAGRFLTLLPDLKFWQVILHSMVRIGSGFLLGVAVGLVLAFFAGRFSFLEELFRPVMTLCKTVPIASFVVLLLIWWGSAYLAVAICFLIVLPNIYISALEGIRSTDVRLVEMASVFHMPLRNRFFYIYRPALRPFLDSSLKLSLGMCWKSGVAAEVIGTPEFSIGEQLYFSKIHLDTADLFAWTAVIILLSICFEKIVLKLVAVFFAWEPECRGQFVVNSRRKCREQINNKPMSDETLPEKIEITNLSKSFGELEVLKDFNAVYGCGETYHFTSPSGSGKTTLFRILCGLEQADNGTVEPACTYSVMFQEDRLCEEYSAVRNVEMVSGDREKAGEALSQLLETEAMDKPCSQLSGGMKRRVALVRAMEAKSDCVILDEPFTGMDAGTRAKAEQYIKERQQGRILLVATHI